ncbi:MAG: single-stranded DNA-binding protein [Spirochaetales bacterium]|nr:single-stranded DNA-binding protein [Spirochaetales bacterium]
MAANLNVVVLIGRLTRDAELKYISSGIAVSKFAIAVNRRKRSGEQWVDETDFFDITLWGKTAETLNQYLVKGKEIGVEGELRQSRWEQDGQPRSRVEIHAKNIQLLGGGGGTRTESNQNDNQKQSFDRFQKEEYSNDFEDDIPF